MWITFQQVEIYMKARKSGLKQQIATAKAGISERSGRDIEKGRRLAPQTKNRDWRTRNDPFSKVWDNELAPMLELQPMLQAITLLEYLQNKYVGSFPDSTLRTLQRRVKQWKVLFGPEREVMFRQKHEPGRLGLSDFTQLKNVEITIQGKPLPHLLSHIQFYFSV